MMNIRLLAMPLAVLVLAACGQHDETAVEAGHGDAGAHVAGAEAPAAADVEATGAWARAVPPNAPVAGGFVRLRNGGATDDRLLSVASPAAERVEIHEMTMDGEVMRMRELADGLPLPAGQMVELKPGGYHLMFIAPDPEAFRDGGTVEATLTFERAGERTVSFAVRGMGAAGADPHGHD